MLFTRVYAIHRNDKAFKEMYSEMVSWIRKASPKAEVIGSESNEKGILEILKTKKKCSRQKQCFYFRNYTL